VAPKKRRARPPVAVVIDLVGSWFRGLADESDLFDLSSDCEQCARPCLSGRVVFEGRPVAFHFPEEQIELLRDGPWVQRGTKYSLAGGEVSLGLFVEIREQLEDAAEGEVVTFQL
jgi:hypothetical protein